MATNQA